MELHNQATAADQIVAVIVRIVLSLMRRELQVRVTGCPSGRVSARQVHPRKPPAPAGDRKFRLGPRADELEDSYPRPEPIDRNGHQLAGGSISANRLIEALMSHPKQFQTFTIIGLALGFVLIAFGIGINWVTESKIEGRELALLASVFFLLCILIRKRIAQRPPP
jgi:hypothetical protein